MAAAATQPPPGFFTFLKHGVLLPARNRALFLPFLALTAALAAALLLANSLAVQPLASAVLLDADAISRADPARNRGLFLPFLALTPVLAAALLLSNSLAVQPLASAVQPLASAVLLDADAISRADPASAAYPALVRSLQRDLRRLLLDVGACVLAGVVVGSAAKIATVFAAVAAFSGTSMRPTVATVVGSARGNLWGPVLTVAFGYGLEVACAGAIVALALLMVFLLEYSLLLLFIDALLVLLASLFLVYLTVVCAVAVVVSAAEPGRRGAGAVSRAWRLMRGKNAQAVLYVVATRTLGAAVSPVYTLALRWWPWSAASGAAAGVAYVLLLGAVEVFSVAAVTAYYFECRESKEREGEMAGHRYAKLPNGDEANI